MSRAERRRAMKAAAKGGPPPPPAREPEIRLENPVSQHYASFIVGNAQFADALVEEGSGAGQSVAICGAGPSLEAHAGDWCPQADQVWGVNSALGWLLGEGHRVTHGFTVDQTPEMLRAWADIPDVEYLIASSCHPHLIALLRERARRYRMFHNFVGIRRRPVEVPDDNGVLQLMSYENWLYGSLYGRTCCAGSGLNSVTRAIDVARFMGFTSIAVLGADCAIHLTAPLPDVPHGSPAHIEFLEKHSVMHAGGGSAVAFNQSPLTLGGEIDGRHWETKIDLAISAIWLVKMAQKFPEVHLIGDTLPNALMDKPDDYLKRLPHLTDSEGQMIEVIL